jgi:acyl-CoA synthetase (AMP-forming)/AMP-acid ligase II
MIKSSYEPNTNIKSDFYGYYDTGDVGFFMGDDLYIIGRENDCFVSCGINVYPHIIEQEISKLDKVISGRVVVFGIFDESLGTHKIYVCAETEETDNSLKIEISSIAREDPERKDFID